jgi:hypothetical protein
MQCPECGWPEIGNMPAGVGSITENNKKVLVGHLTYIHVEVELCSVCTEMKSAVATRTWFLEAHREYLDQVKAKKHLLR